MKKISLCLIMLVIFTGCHPVWHYWEAGYDEVKNATDQQVVGRYQLTTDSKKMMEYEGKYQNIKESYILINADHTYQMVNAPDWIKEDFGESKGKYFDNTGKWSLSYLDNSCMFELDGIAAGSILRQKDNQLALLITVGDPDQGIGMVYEKG